MTFTINTNLFQIVSILIVLWLICFVYLLVKNMAFIGSVVLILPVKPGDEYTDERQEHTNKVGRVVSIDHAPGYGLLYKVYFENIGRGFWFERKEFKLLVQKLKYKKEV